MLISCIQIRQSTILETIVGGSIFHRERMTQATIKNKYYSIAMNS